MSIKVMSSVWANGPQKQAERFVLLALADYANDAGECWPSIASICAKTCMSERGVQSIIARLKADGWLDVEAGGGRKNCNVYRIKTPHISVETQQDMHPLKAETPQMDAETPQMDAETPQMDVKNPAGYAPEPSRTVRNHQQQPREALPNQKQEGLSNRERLLAAIGADPVSGIMGPNGKMLGGPRDMATAAKWADVLSIDEQCAVISERMPKMKNPPGSFAYFDYAMADLVATKSKPMPQGQANSKHSAEDAKLARWAKLGRKTA